MVRCATGGGGYGDPVERSVDAVREDVAERDVTQAMALRRYGIGPE